MKIKISIKTVIWSIVFFCLLKPTGLVTTLGVSSAFSMVRLSVSLLSILLVIKYYKISNGCKAYIGYCLWLMITTLVVWNSGKDVNQCFVVMASNIGMIFFLNYAFTVNKYKIVRAMFWVYFFLLFINFALMIIKPNGLYNTEMMELYHRGNWLFGHVNTTITYVLPAIVVAVLYNLYFNTLFSKIISWLLIACGVGQIIYSKSSTAIIGLVILLIVWAVINFWKHNLFGTYGGIITASVINIAIVFFDIQVNFSSFLEKYLQRDATFTSRTIIWKKSIAQINNNFFFGYGYHVNTFWENVIHGSSSHNEYLYAVLQGGIVLLVLLYCVFIFAMRDIASAKNSKLRPLFIGMIISLLIVFIAETHMHRMAVLIFLITNIHLLDPGNEKSLKTIKNTV